MKIAIYGVVNGVISIIIFEIVNSVGYINGKLSTTLYIMILCVALVLSFVNFKLTKQMKITESLKFSVFSVVVFIVSILPSIFIVGIILNPMISLLIPVKLIEDDMGAGVLLIVVVISYGIGIVISYIINLIIKRLTIYKTGKKI